MSVSWFLFEIQSEDKETASIKRNNGQIYKNKIEMEQSESKNGFGLCLKKESFIMFQISAS